MPPARLRPYLLAVPLGCVLAGVLLGALLAGWPARALPPPQEREPTPSKYPLLLSDACVFPAAMAGAAYAKTWVLLGDALAAGAGASIPAESSYVALLKALARTRLGSDPLVLNAAGPDSLAEQIRAVRAAPAFRAAIERGERILVLVSWGAIWLEAHPDASLEVVVAELSLLFSGNASLAPPDAAGQLAVVLFAHPDPIYGGLLVPAAFSHCPLLNEPTVASRTAHATIYDALRLHQTAFAAARGWGYVHTDVALGVWAWPSAAAADGCAWADCATLNDRGHALLASLLWHCFTH